MAKINKVGRAAHQLHNPARDLLYEYADLQRELDLQINEVEELEGDRLRVHVRLDWNGEALSTSVTV